MSGEARNILKVASIYMATIIGAGFASGQEIVQFFSSYYRGGFFGIVLAGVLFSSIGYIVLDKVYRERIRNYDEFLFPTVGWALGWVMEIAVTLFILSLFCVMVAGMGNILLIRFGIPFIYGIVIMTVLCAAVILTDIRGIVSLSSVVTPVLISGIIAIGLYIIICKDVSVFNIEGYFAKLTDNWVFSSLTYVSYNSLMSVVVLTSLLPYLKTKKTGIIGGILGGLALCVIALILNTAIMVFAPESLGQELPVLNIVKRYGGIINILYTIVLWLAMFLSAVTAGYCFIDRVSSKVRIDVRILTLVICAFVIPMSSLGFANLIATIYPVFGYIGLFMVFAILFQGIKLLPKRIFKK